MIRIIKTISVFLAGSLLGGTIMVWAFTNPTQSPPNGSGILVVDSGKVGIGVVAPSSRLHVSSSGAIDPFLVQKSNGDTSLIVKNTSGTVGIGNNANPNSAYRLDVTGDTNISGKLTVGQLCLAESCKTSWPGPGSGGVVSVFTTTYSSYDCSGSGYGGGGSCVSGSSPVNTGCFPEVPGIAGTIITYCVKN